MKKQIFFIYMLCVLVCTSMAQMHPLAWAKSTGSTGIDRGMAIKSDSAGNIYVLGFFSNTVDMNPNAGVYNLTSAGSTDIFLQKLTPDGHFVWAKQLGGVGMEVGRDIVFDINGNIYLLGTFSDAVDFDWGPGVNVHQCASTQDMFILKLDMNGDFVQVTQIEGEDSFANTSPMAMVIDDDENMYITGQFIGSVDFNPGIDTTLLIASPGFSDLFLLKLDKNGNFKWVQSTYGDSNDSGGDLAINDNGELFLVGNFEGNAYFSGISTQPSFLSDMFLSKVDSANGDFIWVKRFTGDADDFVSKIALDANNNFFLYGQLNSGTLDFDPDTSSFNVTSAIGGSNFITKLAANGDFLWVKALNSTAQTSAIDFSLDANANIYLTGCFTDSLDTDPSANQHYLISDNFNDIFITQLDANGDFVEAMQISGTNHNYISSILLDNSGSIYTTGYFSGITDFDPYSGNSPLVAGSIDDAFVQKLGYGLQLGAIYDIDGNGCDANDPYFQNMQYAMVYGTDTTTYVMDSLGYDVLVTTSIGTYTVTPIFQNPNYFTATPPSITFTFPYPTYPYSQLFCISPSGTHNDAEVMLIPSTVARPGFDAGYELIFRNNGSTTLSGDMTFTFDGTKLSYLSASTSPSSSSANSLTWTYSNLYPTELRSIHLSMNVMQPPTVNIGDLLTFNASITPLLGDEVPLNNNFSFAQTIVGSYDPNDKTCLEGDEIYPDMVGEYLHYVIRFENTGTYPAENIVVSDVIDASKLDISTLVPISSSHSFITKIKENNQVEFIFENIQLPFDNANNDGYIAFKIKSLPTLQIGDLIKNKASIYFDYNQPIITNEAQTVVQYSLGLNNAFDNQDMMIYPNPTHHQLRLDTKLSVQKIEVFDVMGRLIISSKIIDNQLDTYFLSNGIYTAKIYTDKAVFERKFLKE